MEFLKILNLITFDYDVYCTIYFNYLSNYDKTINSTNLFLFLIYEIVMFYV